MSDAATLLFSGSMVGLVAGLSLLAHGFADYRRAGRVADTSTSHIGMLAVGEVRVTGRVEPAELTLTSPLQSRTCVYYRARVREQDSRERRTVLDEERAVGFRVRDETGAVRVFPRGAAWDVPTRFRDADGLSGERPAGVPRRREITSPPRGEAARAHGRSRLRARRPRAWSQVRRRVRG